MRRWEEVFTQGDHKVVQKSGMAHRQPFGTNPALLVIDVTLAFIGSSPKPVLRSVEEHPTSCGEAGWVAVAHIERLLEACRSHRVPTVFTKNDTAPGRTSGVSIVKMTKLSAADEQANTIPDRIAPLPSELVIQKTKPSAFFGTPLNVSLRAMNVDTLLISGGTTSGCLRASVVDAFSYEFKCFVVEECTFDRFELSHLASLFDMNAKYADVISLDEAVKYVGKVGA